MDSIGECEHKFCGDCLNMYIVYKLNTMEDVVCPEEECDTLMDTKKDCYRNLNNDYKKKYEKLQLWKQTLQNPRLKLCPSEHCEGLIDTTVGYRCPKCHL